MSICIYRHKKLYVVMPRRTIQSHQGKGVIRCNFAKVKDDICQVAVHLPNPELPDYLQQISVKIKLSSVGNPTKKELHWNLSSVGVFSTYEQHTVGATAICRNETPGDLVNLAWSYTQKIESIYNMMETICSRSIIELLMHSQEIDAESYDILQMHFSDNGAFVMNVLPIRSYKEALSAALEDRSESPDEWIKLFESA